MPVTFTVIVTAWPMLDGFSGLEVIVVVLPAVSAVVDEVTCGAAL